MAFSNQVYQPRFRFGSALGAITVTLGLICLGLVPRAWAEDTLGAWPWFRLSGFGTLGVVHDSREILHAQRDFGQPDTFQNQWSWRMDSLLGLQANAKLPHEMNAVVQLVLKDRVEATLESSLEWAFLGWRPTSGLALRAGRLGADFYLLSDYRNVSFAYPWQRPPIEFYGPLLLSKFDGADLTYTQRLGRGTLSARLFGGASQLVMEIASGIGADTLNMRSLWGASLTYENERWQLKSGFLRFRFANDPEAFEALGLLDGLNNPMLQVLWPQAAQYGVHLSMEDKEMGFYSLGAAYDDSRWQISGELGHLQSDWEPLRDSLSAYLSVGRHLGDFTPYVVLAKLRPLEKQVDVVAPDPAFLADPTISALYEGTRFLYEVPSLDQQTLSLGLRWDVRPNLALKLQWDHVEIIRSGLWWDGGTIKNDTSAELVSASLNWVF